MLETNSSDMKINSFYIHSSGLIRWLTLTVQNTRGNMEKAAQEWYEVFDCFNARYIFP